MTILARRPKWQFPLFEARAAMSRVTNWMEEPVESQQDRAEGAKLYRILTVFFGLLIAKEAIKSNFYTADGIWFQLKLHPNDVAADDNPVHASTNAVSGHHKSNGKASTTFTLYVGHITPDDSYPDWPQPKALPVREIGLFNTNYTQIRAALATLIEAVETEYERAVPHYQAWLAMQLMPTDKEAATDYLLQLIRQALRRMPASEILASVEPVAIPEADAADEAARMDIGKVEPVATLAELEGQAHEAITKLDEVLAEFHLAGLPPEDDKHEDELYGQEEFNGYDAFDPDDVPDDMDDSDDDNDDDATDPDTSNYELRRIPADVDITEADLHGIEISYPQP